jgi:hypothetical protein
LFVSTLWESAARPCDGTDCNIHKAGSPFGGEDVALPMSTTPFPQIQGLANLCKNQNAASAMALMAIEFSNARAHKSLPIHCY